MADRRCSVCNISESYVGQKVRIVSVGGNDYCETHAPKVDPSAVLTPEEQSKATAEDIMAIRRSQLDQVEVLRSIRGYLTAFMIILIIGFLAQLVASCVP